MKNGRIPLTSDDPAVVSLLNSDYATISTKATFYFHNAGPGEVRVGTDDGISDGTSGVPLAEGEKLTVRTTGNLWVVSSTATELAPVHVHYMVTNR